MSVGRKRVPTSLRVLRGNPGKRPLPVNEPTPPVEAPPCPAWLTGEAFAEWGRMVTDLVAVGMLTRVDGRALAQYCLLHARVVLIAQAMAAPSYQMMSTEADTFIAEDGAGTQTLKTRKNDHEDLLLKYSQSIRLYLAEFGLTPSSRSKVKSALPPATSELDQFVHGL